MLSEERKAFILQQIEEKKSVTNKGLTEQLNASESSIRRDLAELEQNGLLKRVHGGAIALSGIEKEYTMSEKSVKNIQQKRKIAKFANELIENGDIIYIDAGTSTQELLSFLIESKKAVSVVTNSVHHASRLIEGNVRTIILGGTINLATQAVVGAEAVKQLEQYFFDKAFLGMNGVSLVAGYTTTDNEEAHLKHAAIKQSKQAFVLADNEKIEKIAFIKVAQLQEATLITDTISEPLKSELTAFTQVIEVEETT